jgi:hypothetical protein
MPLCSAESPLLGACPPLTWRDLSDGLAHTCRTPHHPPWSPLLAGYSRLEPLDGTPRRGKPACHNQRVGSRPAHLPRVAPGLPNSPLTSPRVRVHTAGGVALNRIVAGRALHPLSSMSRSLAQLREHAHTPCVYGCVLDCTWPWLCNGRSILFHPETNLFFPVKSHLLRIPHHTRTNTHSKLEDLPSREVRAVKSLGASLFPPRSRRLLRGSDARSSECATYASGLHPRRSVRRSERPRALALHISARAAAPAASRLTRAAACARSATQAGHRLV